ncbi:hypothetical protein R3P38DRAFT_2477759, partial [Favolaschia claudopus]
AKDVWTFFSQMERRNHCIFCQQQHAANSHVKATDFGLKTGTGTLRKHLYDNHLDAWVAGCDRLKIPITAEEAQPFLADYRRRHGQSASETGSSKTKDRKPFSHEGFVNAIVEFIVGDDQSINVIENQQLRAIFLMLREELKDADIPHRTTIRKRILEVWEEHLDSLEKEMAHLGHAFLHILDRLSILEKLGWVTLDNASNNDTFMRWL